MNIMLCAMLTWRIITPLGSDVEPDVYCRKATACIISSAGAAAAAADDNGADTRRGVSGRLSEPSLPPDSVAAAAADAG